MYLSFRLTNKKQDFILLVRGNVYKNLSSPVFLKLLFESDVESIVAYLSQK